LLLVVDMRERLDRLLRLAAQAAEFAVGRVVAPYQAWRAIRFRAPERLRIAPQDIRTADATVADEIYAGYFSFDGKILNVRGRSPFSVEPPSVGWRRSLGGFSWLRHLRVADTPLARENARALVGEFIELRGLPAEDPAVEPVVAARRMLSFLAHSPMLLDGAEAEFYDGFMRALAEGAGSLSLALGRRHARAADRLLCALALLEFGICADADSEMQSQATKLFIQELERQILRDGGHIGRNPKTILELLLDFLPLWQLYAARGVNPPQALFGAIERMIPMLRLLQHGDGALALFNGMDATAPGKLATVFMHEPPRDPPLSAPQSGYQRMVTNGALAIIDAGAPPPQEFSRAAHAGALSFEFSLGRDRVVVNCGAPSAQQEALREIARATAAHSTLAIDDQSSCEIAPVSSKRHPGLIVDGPRNVRMERRQTKSGQVIELAHDGYARRFGLIHERTLALTNDGVRFIGQERLVVASDVVAQATPLQFVLRFHLHPGVRVQMHADERKVELTLPSGALLLFEASNFAPKIEESLFFAAPEGARKTVQIVITGPAAAQMRLRWSFRRVADFGDRDASDAVPASLDS
jgi:uncharacterized heparinase superfamily protein